MASMTSYMNLTKPELTDAITPTVFADNFQIIDTKVEEMDTNITKFTNSTIVRTFTLSNANWVANNDSVLLPYKYVISSSAFKNTSRPLWLVEGVNGVPTDAEMPGVTGIQVANFDASGITLYAASQPGADLRLVVKGDD